jgi:hypothetical protein
MIDRPHPLVFLEVEELVIDIVEVDWHPSYANPPLDEEICNRPPVKKQNGNGSLLVRGELGISRELARR